MLRLSCVEKKIHVPTANCAVFIQVDGADLK